MVFAQDIEQFIDGFIGTPVIEGQEHRIIVNRFYDARFIGCRNEALPKPIHTVFCIYFRSANIAGQKGLCKVFS